MKFFVVILVILSLVSPVFSQSNTPTSERVGVTANEIDAKIVTLSGADQLIIDRIRPLIKSGDVAKLTEAYQAKLPGQIQDKAQRAFWNMALYVAMNFAGSKDCAGRGLWFTFLVGSFYVEDKSCAGRVNSHYAYRAGGSGYKILERAHDRCLMLDQPSVDLLNRAQRYVAASGETSDTYACHQ